nr:hypothetical protein [Tanacetum cinerariifolium]
MSIYDFITLPSWGDAKVAEESHHLSSPLLECVSSHTTASTAKGDMILLPTPNEIAASLPDPCLAKKSKGPSQVSLHLASNTAPKPSQPSKKRKLKKRASEAGLVLQSTSTKASSAPTPRPGRRLGAPPFMAVMDPLDSLARSALAHDVEYDQILEDDFSIATHGASSLPYTKEEWNGPHAPEDNILCEDIFKDSDVCKKALDRTFTPAELKRTKSLLPLDISNRFNEKFDRKARYVKVLRSEVTNLDGKLKRIRKDFDALGKENRELRSQKYDASDKVKELQTELTDARVASIGLLEELSKPYAKLSVQALVVRDLQNRLALEKAKSQGYKDAVDGLREEVTRFVGSGVESLFRKFLSSDEFHVALAHVASLGLNYGIERRLRIGRTDAEFKVGAQKVSNFYIGAKDDFDKALVNFPTTPFPFLGKITAAAGGTLPEVTQVLPDKHIHFVTSVPVAPPIANEDANQVPLEHASDDSIASI